MKSKIFLSILIVSILMLSVINVMAFMPKGTHRYIWEQSLAEPLQGSFYSDCMKNKDLCYAGTVLDDVTVISYYTNKGLYGLTHSPQFCSALLNNVAKVPGANVEHMKACAIGGCMHEPADISSHSRQNKDGTGEDGLVAYAIKHSLIVNNVIHVFAEQKVDNEMIAKYPELEQATIDALQNNYQECQPLFELSMLGLDSNLDKNQLNTMFDTFIQETLNYQGYKPAYEEKSFLGTLNVIPITYLLIYFVLMAGLILINTLLFLKIIKKQSKIRHWIGMIIFIPLLLIMIYLAWGALQGSAFNNFLGLINPITNFVPTGNTQTYIDNGIENTKNLLIQGEGWLDRTDASGMGQIPVLFEADAQVLLYDYIIIGVIVIALLVFIWYLFKKNKVIKSNGLGGF